MAIAENRQYPETWTDNVQAYEYFCALLQFLELCMSRSPSSLICQAALVAKMRQTSAKDEGTKRAAAPHTMQRHGQRTQGTSASLKLDT